MTGPRPQTVWTDALNDQLLRLHRAGLSIKAIAAQMDIPWQAVEKRCWRLGLARDKPGQPNPALAEQRLDNRRARQSRPKTVTDPIKRRCLKCRKPFRSQHRRTDWVCPRCEQSAEWKDGDDATYGRDSRWVGNRAGAS